MNNKKHPLVFTEWHHGGLFQAMVNTFEKRQGGLVFGPTGYEWKERNYWRLSDLPETVKQYLDPESIFQGQDGYQYYYDKAELRVQRRITFEQFKKIKFDIILC